MTCVAVKKFNSTCSPRLISHNFYHFPKYFFWQSNIAEIWLLELHNVLALLVAIWEVSGIWMISSLSASILL